MYQQVHAFLGSDDGVVNLYNTIDEGYKELEEKNLTLELSGPYDSIKENVNVLISDKLDGTIENCIGENLTPTNIQSIALGNIATLEKVISEECKGKNSIINISTLTDVQKVISDHYKKSELDAYVKSKQMHTISTLGIYSDGVIENSDFDLIEDLKQINSIIFTRQIPYDGEEYEDFQSNFNSLVEISEAGNVDEGDGVGNNYSENEKPGQNPSANIEGSAGFHPDGSINIAQNGNSNYNIYGTPIGTSDIDDSHGYSGGKSVDFLFDSGINQNYLCYNETGTGQTIHDSYLSQIYTTPSDNSGNLSYNYYNNSLEGNTGVSFGGDKNGNSLLGNLDVNIGNPSEGSISIIKDLSGNIIHPILDPTDPVGVELKEMIDKTVPHEVLGEYVSINDNANWPCEGVFCIMIDYVVHEQPLLGGSESVSIEYLIGRSNKHLRQFASTSLVQANMTTNNFEIGLKDLNLADMFHMSFQIQEKPVPILNIRANGKTEATNRSVESLLEKYYKAYHLDYKRKNDISRLRHDDEEKKSVINSSDLNVNSVLKTHNDFMNIIERQAVASTVISNDIIQTLSIQTLDEFSNQFIELNNFSTTMINYTESLDQIVDAMLKIPISE
ncbi:MAG: hypothetical protein GY828_00380 [Candidatus Gracilibacteria bacterium]|nr:hypothetical protein [Candidatus Gracilibacteria bacterium]